MHQPRHVGVTVAWNEWVSFDDMGPWLSKSAQDFILLSSRSKSRSMSFSYSVCLVGCSLGISIEYISI